ncbi:MAG: LysR family transcriptional regulator [Proteobacteria bacterium]|nr:LysR family transcriptional regulator [Pseudomonadota bacterium]
MISVSTPDIHLLRVFVTVAEAGGFSQAQIALNVSQSTISTQMADLETRLGLVLCKRGRAGFALTDDGRIVYEAAKELFGNCNAFSSKIGALRSEITGELHIATADALLNNPDFPLDRIIAELHKRIPKVSLSFRQHDPLEIERQVLNQTLHAGIHTFPNHAPGLRYIRLFSERQTLYCGRDHSLFTNKSFPSIEDLALFDYAGRNYYGGMLRPGLMQPKRLTSNSSNLDGIVALILSGHFIGHLPDHAAEPWLKARMFRAILPDQLSYDSQFEAVFAVGSQRVRAQRVFEEVLLKYVGQRVPSRTK